MSIMKNLSELPRLSKIPHAVRAVENIPYLKSPDGLILSPSARA